MLGLRKLARPRLHGALDPSVAQSGVVAVIMLAGWSGGQWFEATFALQPMVSLVYPSVYPTKVDGSESKGWCGQPGVFRFRPRLQDRRFGPNISN